MLNTAFSCLPVQSGISVLKPTHTGSQRQLLSGALGCGNFSCCSSCRKCWVTSPPPKPRSLHKVRPGAAILRQKTRKSSTSFSSEEWDQSSEQQLGSTCMQADVKITVLALRHCRCFLPGTPPGLCQMAAREMVVHLQTFPSWSSKAFRGQAHPFSWTELHGCWANHNGIVTGEGWGWRRASLEISLQIKILGNCLSLLSSTVVCRVVENLPCWSHTGMQQESRREAGPLTERRAELCRQGEAPALVRKTSVPCPPFPPAKRQSSFKIHLYFGFVKNELFSGCCSVAGTIGLTVPCFLFTGRKWARIAPMCFCEPLGRKTSSSMSLF